jgi:hypothetical protein
MDLAVAQDDLGWRVRDRAHGCESERYDARDRNEMALHGSACALRPLTVPTFARRPDRAASRAL